MTKSLIKNMFKQKFINNYFYDLYKNNVKIKKIKDYVYLILERLKKIEYLILSRKNKKSYLDFELKEIIDLLNNNLKKNTKPIIYVHKDSKVNVTLKKISNILEIKNISRHNSINSQIRNIRLIKKKLRTLNIYPKYFNSTYSFKSFDYQWKNLDSGKNLISDFNFRAMIESQIVEYSELNKDWFKNKRVLDLGCGSGRFSLGFVNLGSKLTCLDQSKSGLEAVKKKLANYKNVVYLNENILKPKKIKKGFYDFIWCFGVVHHTGDTLKSLKNIKSFLKKDGKVFLMIYGEPITPEDFYEIDMYNTMRSETKPLNFYETINYLREKFDSNLVHGYFDAISPNINELYEYDDIINMLTDLGFINIKKINIKSRNHFLTANI